MVSKQPNTTYSHERIAKALAKANKFLGKATNSLEYDVVGPTEIRLSEISAEEAYENPSKLSKLLNQN